jgi:hypothetical protein
MILLALAFVCLLVYLAERRRARIFNERDKSGDYRTTWQRRAKW